MIRAVIPQEILEQRVIPVARRLTAESAPALAGALARGGLTVLEVTVEGEGGIEAIASLRGSGLVVGAGTVTSMALAAASVEAGAKFLVSPHFDPTLVGWASGRGIPIFPGGLTPTEVASVWASGASAVKVFPASIGGPELIKALKAPFPEIILIPTGGITADNAAEYLSAGSVAVGIGAWLTGSPDPDVVSERAVLLAKSLQLV